MIENNKPITDYDAAHSEALYSPVRDFDYSEAELTDLSEIYAMSNEPLLHLLYPEAQDIEQAIWGVGSDQIIDLFTNSNAQKGVIIDIKAPTIALTRLRLELGLWHKYKYGAYPTAIEYKDYFNIAKIPDLQLFLQELHSGGHLSDSYYQYASDNLLRHPETDGTNTRHPSFEDYMNYRADNMQIVFNGTVPWHEDDAKLHKALRAYESGNLVIEQGDITNARDIESIQTRLGTPVDVIYLSNVESYGSSYEDMIGKLVSGLKPLSTHSKSRILRAGLTIDSPSYPTQELDELRKEAKHAVGLNSSYPQCAGLNYGYTYTIQNYDQWVKDFEEELEASFHKWSRYILAGKARRLGGEKMPAWIIEA
jgi:hypothetical protein